MNGFYKRWIKTEANPPYVSHGFLRKFNKFTVLFREIKGH
ncbi:hypothetical protein NIES2104_09340 [Leptolyngbya sp. NIES-2104]|nr:hypothetical protein NIES2104_09340 [Leptolyngbya sp. NIES-2104]